MADKPTTQATDAPKASLFPESVEKVVAVSPAGTEEPKKESPAPPKTKPTMVIDANVLIKSADLQALAQKYSLATVAQAVKEVRDPNARMRLGTIMGDLKIMIPGKEHLAKVSEFAKKTGDCVSISVTDAHLIALALMLIEQKGNSHMVRSEPARAENFGGDPAQETAEGTINGEEGNSDGEESIPETTGNTVTQASQGETTPSESTGKPAEEEVDPDEEYQRVDEDDGWMVATGPEKKKPESGKRERKQTEESISSDSKTFTSKALTPVVKSPHPEEKGELAPQLWYEDKDFEQDDEDGWITPHNLKDVVQGSEVVEVSQLESIGVGVMTADFAMQNLILQMGVPLLSVEGMIIKKIKSYVLECFTCLNICRDNSKQFCPSCGHNSLLRVTCSFNKDGSFILYRRKDFKVSTRGMRYAIPRPKGGQNSDDLIISQDDLNRIQHRMKYHSKPNTHESQMRAAEEAYEYAYGLDGANKISRPVNLKPGYGRNNPNDNGFRKKISSKRG